MCQKLRRLVSISQERSSHDLNYDEAFQLSSHWSKRKMEQKQHAKKGYRFAPFTEQSSYWSDKYDIEIVSIVFWEMKFQFSKDPGNVF